jgi:hypothetical protein
MVRNAGNRASGDDRIRLVAVTPAASASSTDQWSGSNSTLPSVAHASFVANPIAPSAAPRASKRSSAMVAPPAQGRAVAKGFQVPGVGAKRERERV